MYCQTISVCVCVVRLVVAFPKTPARRGWDVCACVCVCLSLGVVCVCGGGAFAALRSLAIQCERDISSFRWSVSWSRMTRVTECLIMRNAIVVSHISLFICVCVSLCFIISSESFIPCLVWNEHSSRTPQTWAYLYIATQFWRKTLWYQRSN